MTEKLPTIKLKGKDYVQVKDRILFFNEEYPNGSIRTEVEHKQDGSYAWMKAIVIPDVKNPERYFVGRSASPVDEEKSYEKLETVAVGRALALMGIGILESVASAEEIQKFFNAPEKPKSSYDKIQEKQLRPGDQLATGISKSSGKPWFAIQRGKNKVWLTQLEYEALNGLPSDGVSAFDGAPLPDEPPMSDLPF